MADLIKLNTNENPYPPSPKVAPAIEDELAEGGKNLRLYPDPNTDLVKDAVCRHFSGTISNQNVFVGNGSDEVLALVFLALLKRDRPLLFPDVTYSFYKVYAGLFDIAFQTIPLDEDFDIRISDYEKEKGPIVLANPNAPTGKALPLNAIEHLLQINPQDPVVIDEAYVDFGAASAMALIARYPNLLLVRTLSKSHALAGMRVGYAVGHSALIEALTRVKNSFNSYPLDRLAIRAAVAALDDKAYLELTRQKIIQSRNDVAAQMTALGFRVLPSCTNFLFVSHPKKAASDIAQALRARKILVRHFQSPRIENFLRISIGTDAECALLLVALGEIVKTASMTMTPAMND